MAILLLAAGTSLLARPARAASPSFVFSAAGDYGSWGGLSETLHRLNDSKYDFNLALGDLSYGGNTGYANSTEKAWCDKFHRFFPNVELIAGNHDTGQQSLAEGNINNFTTYCPFTLNAAVIGNYGKQYYFDYPAANPIARFVLISPDLVFVVDNGEHYDYTRSSPRYNWTANAIDGARAAGIPWVIVAMHKNCIAAGEHACEIGTDILNLLIEKKVDLILQAHSHNYERSKQLALNGGTCKDGIVLHLYRPDCVVHDGLDGQYTAGLGSVLVIQGTGGRQIDPFNLADPYAPYFASWMGNNTPGLENAATVAGLGNGVVAYTVDANQISMKTNFNLSASFFSDSFTIVKPSTLIQTLLTFAPVFALAGIAIAAVLVWRRRRARKRPRIEL